uniref:Pre-mRNA polyadenylation factor Fip1 domain-containing protein n=1 Tax=Amphiprion ocellaris TaxID=80972 RepID=A0A3Q1AM03_AMPOC
MSTSESESSIYGEEDEDGKLYQWIFEMSIRDDNRQETEQIKIASSSEHTPEHLEINAEGIHAAEALDIDELENIKGCQESNLNVKSLDEKPWRKSGANVSDYFNYGFDEESWNAYCQKQLQIRRVRRKLHAKVKAQRRHTGHGEDESSCAHSPSGRPSTLASRDPHAAPTETGGIPRSRNREKRHQCLNTQVDTEMSHKEDSITADHLPPPSNLYSSFAYVSPPSFLFQSRPSPPSPSAIFDSGHSNDFDGPSTSLYARSSGSIFTRAGVIDTTKVWEYYTRQLKCDRHKDRSREHGHDKKSKRGRSREKERHTSSHNSAEKQKNDRDTSERRQNRHSSQRVSGERRHRDRSEDWSKRSQSSSSMSRRDDEEDRESRHTHKKARRSRKGSESNISADQERKLKSD